MSKSKNDIAWSTLFEKYQIVDNVLKDGRFVISSTEINTVREARLMTKFDHRSQLPFLFAKNDLSILPISRGNYVIGKLQTFHNFNKDDIEIEKIIFPSALESLDYNNITSESTAINCAFVSKILHDFTGEGELFPTISGRMSSLAFDFQINSEKKFFDVSVLNSQIEIDGGYEGDSSLTLIEAKNYISDDFLIRQLYYPYRLWANKVSKPVRPVFLTYTNGVFHLREYCFMVLEQYNSLELIREKKYAIQDGSINIEMIEELLDNAIFREEPQLPFPQADSFERVVNLCELLNENELLMKEEITQNYGFDARQTDYYVNAGRYLGLIDITNQGCCLTNIGKWLFSLSITIRQVEFIKLILSYTVFNKTLKLYFDNSALPNKEEIVEIMKAAKLYNIESDATYSRRASTIKRWINWIMDQIEE